MMDSSLPLSENANYIFTQKQEFIRGMIDNMWVSAKTGISHDPSKIRFLYILEHITELLCSS